MLSFVWDEEKNKINVLKHGVSFQEAQTVFEDENELAKSQFATSL